jgi:hypothetical protein
VNVVLRNASRVCGYSYSLQSTAPWARVNPLLTSGRVGSSPAKSAPAARDSGQGNGFEPLLISARGLAAGVHLASLVVQSQDAVRNPTRVRIRLNVVLAALHHGVRRRRADRFTG